MVRVAYQAEVQVAGLSPKERRDLDDVLGNDAAISQAMKMADSRKFVSRLGEDKRVVWQKEDSGDVVVLAVVTK